MMPRCFPRRDGVEVLQHPQDVRVALVAEFAHDGELLGHRGDHPQASAVLEERRAREKKRRVPLESSFSGTGAWHAFENDRRRYR